MASGSKGERPCILLTNDDGVHAPGLLALARSLRTMSEVVVIAPERNWSAAGHSKTMHKPLRVARTRLGDGSEALATSGSPSDCVALALLGLLERRPALVVSGINPTANVGHDLTYSGTVAAAMEASVGGIHAIAVSLDATQVDEVENDAHLSAAARFVARLAEQFLAADIEEALLLNVNVPALPEEEIRGVRITKLGHRLYRDALVRREDPRGRPYYWIGGDPPGSLSEPGTDIGALAEGCISVTPISLDLTDHAKLPLLRSWRLEIPPSRGKNP